MTDNSNNTTVGYTTKAAIYARDRSTLDLPKTQICEECEVEKDSDDFRLARRNQHQKKEKLEDICIQCIEKRKLIKKGVYLKHMKTGTHLISDALIAKLTENNNKKLNDVAGVLIDAVTGITPPTKTRIEALNLLITSVQGRPLGTKLLDSPEGKKAANSNSAAESSVPAGDDELLSRI